MFRTTHFIPGIKRSLVTPFSSSYGPCCSQRPFSSEVAPGAGAGPSSSLMFFKTSETDPVKLNSTHLGRLYTIKDDIFQKLYAQHHGFPLEFREQCKLFREQCVMVRKPFLDLKNCVDSLDLEKPTVRFIIYGKLGVGKTMTLSPMVQYGYLKEFVLVHFPWIPLWTSFVKELVPSINKPGYFNHTLDAVAWLGHFKNQNSELIQKLNLITGKDYEWSKREKTPKGSPLLALVEHGISRPVHASECLYALVEELKEQSTQKKCKTMVIIDGINGIFYDCPFFRSPDKKKVPPSQITVFEAMKNLIRPDWSGGVVITTVDKRAMGSDHREGDLPRYLLKQEGWELFDPFVPIEVVNYTSQEVQTTIDYYLERKWLGHPRAGSEEGRLELEYLSTKNPRVLMELCNYR